jgi:hypothetical protein
LVAAAGVFSTILVAAHRALLGEGFPMAAWVKALKALIEQIPSDDDLNHIVHEIYHSEARGAALVASTQVEEILRRFLKGFMVPLSIPLEEGLFDRDAPLSSFSKLIRVAFAFKLIDQTVRHHLDIVREIRNTFAHAMVHVTFETPAIQTACLLLPRYFEEFEGGISPDHPKARYIGATTRLMKLFAEAMQSETTSIPLNYPD